jgi:WD40 repeat protein
MAYQHVLAGFSADITAMAFSPDGKYLAIGDEAGVSLWEVHTWSVKYRAAVADARGIAVMASIGSVAIGTCGHGLKVWSPLTGRTRDVTTADCVQSVAAVPDRRRLLAVNVEGDLSEIDVPDGKRIARRQLGTPIKAVAYSPARGVAATADYDMDIKLWRERDLTRLGVLPADPSNIIYTLSFTRDGGTLASGGSDGSVKVWDVEKGKALRRLTGSESEIVAVRFVPGDRTIAGAGGQYVRLWNVNTGSVERTLKAPCSAIWAMDVSPDGRWLAAGGTSDKKVYIWRLTQ